MRFLVLTAVLVVCGCNSHDQSSVLFYQSESKESNRPDVEEWTPIRESIDYVVSMYQVFYRHINVDNDVYSYAPAAIMTRAGVELQLSPHEVLYAFDFTMDHLNNRQSRTIHSKLHPLFSAWLVGAIHQGLEVDEALVRSLKYWPITGYSSYVVGDLVVQSMKETELLPENVNQKLGHILFNLHFSSREDAVVLMPVYSESERERLSILFRDFRRHLAGDSVAAAFLIRAAEDTGLARSVVHEVYHQVKERGIVASTMEASMLAAAALTHIHRRSLRENADAQ